MKSRMDFKHFLISIIIFSLCLPLSAQDLIDAQANEIAVSSLSKLDFPENEEPVDVLYAPNGKIVIVKGKFNRGHYFYFYELKSKSLLLESSGDELHWSPEAKRVVLKSSRTQAVYMLETNELQDLHPVDQGEFWFWLNEETLMFRVTGGAYSLNLSTRESQNFGFEEAKQLKGQERTIATQARPYRNLSFLPNENGYERKKLSGLVAKSLNYEYCKVIARIGGKISRVYMGPDPRYLIATVYPRASGSTSNDPYSSWRNMGDKKNKQVFLISLERGKASPYRYNLLMDWRKELSPDNFDELFELAFTQNQRIIGKIFGAKTNPYNDQLVGVSDRLKAIFKVVAVGEKEISIQITEQLIEVTTADVASFSTLQKRASERGHIRTASAWCKLEPFREIENPLSGPLLGAGKGSGERSQMLDYPSPDEFFFVDEEPQPLNMDEIRQKIGYPEHLREQNIEGRVVIRVLVDQNGTYRKHKVVKTGHPLLLDLVLKELPGLTFTPAKRAGQPIMFWTNLPFQFKLMSSQKIFPEQEKKSTEQNASLPFKNEGEIGEMKRRLLGDWKSAKNGETLFITENRAVFVDRKGRKFQGTWDVVPILVGYALEIYGPDGKKIKGRGIIGLEFLKKNKIQVHSNEYWRVK
jgi:TonB family protein